ncbi:MAG: hypothetical protein LUB56_02200 [Coprobacillus sp.]|nr:hypothetical protein [Coprobacillus sp.]
MVKRKTQNLGINKLGIVSATKGESKGKHSLLVGLTSLVAIITLASCGTTIDYSFYNAEELEDNITSLYSRYERREKNGNFDPYGDDFEPYELVEIALHKYELNEQSYSIVSGLTLAAFNTRQVTHVFNIKDGDEYFNEALSTSGLVNQAHRFYQKDDTVTEYHVNGKSNVSEKSASYDKDSFTEYDLDSFEEYYGKQFSRASIYIVSSKTVLEQEKTTTSDGNIVVSLDLDPILGVLRYVKQMCVNGNLDNEPVFEDTNVSFTFDSSMELISLDVYEHYSVKILGVDFGSEGWVREEYHGGESFTIPAVDESLESYYTEVEFDEN